jgi:hypothetical protein
MPRPLPPPQRPNQTSVRKTHQIISNRPLMTSRARPYRFKVGSAASLNVLIAVQEALRPTRGLPSLGIALALQARLGGRRCGGGLATAFVMEESRSCEGEMVLKEYNVI